MYPLHYLHSVNSVYLWVFMWILLITFGHFASTSVPSPCPTAEDASLHLLIQELKFEIRKDISQLTNIVEDQSIEIASLKDEISGMRANPRDLPYIMSCGFTNHWTKAGATVTYDKLLSDFNNSGKAGPQYVCCPKQGGLEAAMPC